MNGKRIRSAVDLHRCTDAENTPENLPLCATFRGARRSSMAETPRRMSNRHQRIGTGLCVDGRFQKKVANARGKVAQVNPVVVHYVQSEGRGRESGRRAGVREDEYEIALSRGRLPPALALGRGPRVHPPYNVARASKMSSIASVHGLKSYIEAVGELKMSSFVTPNAARR
jgi:hypothetical protein